MPDFDFQPSPSNAKLIGDNWQNFLRAFVKGEQDKCHSLLAVLERAARESKDPTIIYCANQADFILRNGGATSFNFMGPTGCGKSAIGESLAKLIGGVFDDADRHHPEANREKMRNNIPLTDEDRVPFLTGVRNSLAEGTLDRVRISTGSGLMSKYRAAMAGADIRHVLETSGNPWDPCPANLGLVTVYVQKSFDRALFELDRSTKDPKYARMLDGQPHYIKVTYEDPKLLQDQYAKLAENPPPPYQALRLNTDEYYDEKTGKYAGDRMIKDLLEVLPIKRSLLS